MVAGGLVEVAVAVFVAVGVGVAVADAVGVAVGMAVGDTLVGVGVEVGGTAVGASCAIGVAGVQPAAITPINNHNPRRDRNILIPLTNSDRPARAMDNGRHDT